MRLIEYSKKIHSNTIKKINDEKLKEMYHRKCFKIIEAAAGDRDEMEKVAKAEGIGFATLTKYGYQYAKEKLGYSDYEIEKNFKEPQRIISREKVKKNNIIAKKDQNKIYFQLLEENNPEKIFEIIENSQNIIGMNTLKCGIYGFASIYFEEEKDAIINEITKKIQMYLNHQSQIRKEEREKEKKYQKEIRKKEVYEELKYIVELFINSKNLNKKEFCKINGIDMVKFDLAIELCKQYDSEIYDKYQKIIQMQQQKRYIIIMQTIKKIVDKIKNGVECENNTIRNFDLIDYYSITTLDFEQILRIIKDSNEIPVDELRSLRIFIAKNKNYTKNKEYEVKHFLDGKIIINDLEITEEKEKVIKFLRKNNIPLNYATCNLVLKRYLNNTLSLDGDEDTIISVKK